ncbi:MAG: polyphosphate polymerase domain-containing protein [Acholeplasmatales bacterium]|nr:polyphosphate polymerase domain-containing protein [Acholeplasmatales bacterium]
MSDAISVMKRYEIKYILNSEQINYLVNHLEGHMKVDEYGKTSIASLYYDTPNYRLIRESLDKPEFKEKVRLRSYGLNKPGKPVYLELKRKAYEVVYKRRVATSVDDVNDFFNENSEIAEGQIAKEITYFRDFYEKLIPQFLVIYDRVAYFEPDGDLRLTIDYNPRYRHDDLSLDKSMDGISLLPDGSAILEVKVQQAIPLWLSKILNDAKIYKASFSKVGEAYKRQILNM